MANETIPSLQEAIENRAAQKLAKDLLELSNFVRTNKFLSDQSNGAPKLFYKTVLREKDYEIENFPYWVFEFSYEKRSFESNKLEPRGSIFMKDLFYRFLLEYIKQETDNFLQLVEEVEDLKAGKIDF